ncbi:hypothetical protein [Thermogutta sp.]|uniref:hypothetical protein n=1 Tax=Thermogutta sp. TaxID=1962930 RepID=UPI00321F7603
MPKKSRDDEKGNGPVSERQPASGQAENDSRKKVRGKKREKQRSRKSKLAGQKISVREISLGIFELVYPPRVRQFKEDIEEVYDIIAHEEWDLAVDELLWLLQQCRDLLEAHQLLGRIALYRNKLELARGHLGYAFELGLKALGKDFKGRLPLNRPTNQPFLQAARDLVECLVRLGERGLAHSVAEQLLTWTPEDPLGVRRILEQPEQEPAKEQETVGQKLRKSPESDLFSGKESDASAPTPSRPESAQESENPPGNGGGKDGKA